MFVLAFSKLTHSLVYAWIDNNTPTFKEFLEISEDVMNYEAVAVSGHWRNVCPLRFKIVKANRNRNKLEKSGET